MEKRGLSDLKGIPPVTKAPRLSSSISKSVDFKLGNNGVKVDIPPSPCRS
jgi:hypothetical protein